MYFSIYTLRLLVPSLGLEQICDAYRLRWQVELTFKEWKSYTSLHAFDTSKAKIARGTDLGRPVRGYPQT